MNETIEEKSKIHTHHRRNGHFHIGNISEPMYPMHCNCSVTKQMSYIELEIHLETQERILNPKSRHLMLQLTDLFFLEQLDCNEIESQTSNNDDTSFKLYNPTSPP